MQKIGEFIAERTDHDAEFYFDRYGHTYLEAVRQDTAAGICEDKEFIELVNKAVLTVINGD